MNLSDDMDQTADALAIAGDEAGSFMLSEIRVDWIHGRIPLGNAKIALASAKKRLEALR